VEKITIDSLGIGMAMLFQGNEASKKAVPCGAAFFGVLLFLRLLLGSKSVEDTDRNQLGDILALEEDLFDVGRPSRDSYYRTDTDATAMCLKEDYYSGLGSNMHAAYNVQYAVSSGIIVGYYVSQDRSDSRTFPAFVDRLRDMWGAYPSAICADAGYGSLANYQYLRARGIGNFVKYPGWEGEVSGTRPAFIALSPDGALRCIDGKEAAPVPPPRHPRYCGSEFVAVEHCGRCPYMRFCAFFGVLLFLRLLLGSKSVEDTDRNQLGDILALEEDLFDVGRGDKGLIPMRHQIDHLDIRRQEFVDFMQLELRFVVGDSPQASYQSLRAQFTGLLDDQAFGGRHLDVRVVLDGFLDHPDPFFGTEEIAGLLGVVGHQDNHLVEDLPCP
jgi:hypothetical protein